MQTAPTTQCVTSGPSLYRPKPAVATGDSTLYNARISLRSPSRRRYVLAGCRKTLRPCQSEDARPIGPRETLQVPRFQSEVRPRSTESGQQRFQMPFSTTTTPVDPWLGIPRQPTLCRTSRPERNCRELPVRACASLCRSRHTPCRGR